VGRATETLRRPWAVPSSMDWGRLALERMREPSMQPYLGWWIERHSPQQS
jgi:hypothetical protein